MDLGLTTEQKIGLLNASKSTMQVEAYNILVRLGVDPDTYSAGNDISVSDSFIGEKVRLDGLLESIAFVESKLTALS
jgi:hypothetical protein